MPRKTPQPHIHPNVDVTPARLIAFALAPRSEQTTVLATLRAQSADTSGSAVLTLTGLLLAVLLVTAAPLLTIEVEPHLRSNPVFVAVTVSAISIVLLAAFVPAFIGAARDTNTKERAAVWLGAYQDEIARRHRLRGHEARRWQRTH